MIRTLLIISGAAAVLCAATFGGALALGGSDLQRHGWAWTMRDSETGESIRFQRAEDGPTVTRDLAWTGGERLVLDLPARVDYVQGATASVRVSGPQRLVDRVRLDGDRLTMTEETGATHVVTWSDSDDLVVTVTAPSVSTFQIDGSGDLSIRDYDRPSLVVTVNGSGDVDARGVAALTTVAVNGSGDVDVSGIQGDRADVSVSGSGDVVAGPAQEARVNTSGSGDVQLTRRAARLIREGSGSGDVDFTE